MTVENKSFRLANDPAMPRPGDLLKDRYRVERPLGEGGFAAVFKALDTTTGASVAIKILDPIMSRRDEFTQRFLREVETISALTHYNTIRVTDKGETASGCLFLVMELLEGGSLDDLLEKKGPMPLFLVRSIATQVLRSLSEAHSKNIIHRDIKPANIFLVQMPGGENDHVKVLDFGIAKTIDGGEESALTSTGQVVCSPHYVAPERVVDHVTVPSSDIYSLGVSMIEMLEGLPPYESDTPIQLVMKHARLDDPVPMQASTRDSSLGPIIAKATAKDYRQRYQSAQEMLADLKAIENGGVVSAAHVPAPVVVQDDDLDEKRSVLRFWPILLLLIILIVAGLVVSQFTRKSTDDGVVPVANSAQSTPETRQGSLLTDVADLDDKFPVPNATDYVVDSIPSGASVRFGNKVVGDTPLRVEHDQVPELPFELHLRLPDGRELTHTVRSHAELKRFLHNFRTAPAPGQNPAPEQPSSTNNGSSVAGDRVDGTTSPSTSTSPSEPERPPMNTADPKPTTPSEPTPTAPTTPSEPTTRPAEPADTSTTKPKPAEPAPPRPPTITSPLPNFGGDGGGSYFGK